MSAACAPEPSPVRPNEPEVATGISASIADGRCTAPSLALGDRHTCLVQADGTLTCWGSNASLQLGLAGTTNRLQPTAIAGLTGVTAVVGGATHTCTLHANGQVRCWGANSLGQLGDLTTTKRSAPALVSNLTGVTALAAGSQHTCALKSDGTVWCWGYNASGQLGDGTLRRRTAPVQVANITHATAIAAGAAHTCALVNNGQDAYCWGSNGYGQLGDESRTIRTRPVRVHSTTAWRSIALGQYHTCGIHQAAGNGIECWGRNIAGQLGDETTVAYRTAPVAVHAGRGLGPLTDGAQLTAAGSETCAILGDATARCWGRNTYGQLGDGTVTTLKNYAVAVNAPPALAGQFLLIAAGGSQVCAENTSGAIFCWGANTNGQLGDNSRTRRLTPTAITAAPAPLTFTTFTADDELTSASHGAATSIASDGTNGLWVAGLETTGSNTAWVVRRSTDGGANWAASSSFTYEAGKAMLAPELTRLANGTLFLAGTVTDSNDVLHWLVRRSIDGGASWTNADDFVIREGQSSGADQPGVDAAGNVFVPGFAADANGLRHWIVRSSDSGTTWTAEDDYSSYSGATASEAHQFLDAGSAGKFVVGQVTTNSGARMLVRKAATGTYANADDFQLEAGHDTIGVGLAVDLGGRLFAIARADSSNGMKWVVRRSLDAGATWGTADTFQLDQGQAARPEAILVDRNGGVIVVGTAARAGVNRGVLRSSSDHGATWRTTENDEGTTFASAALDLASTLHVAGTNASLWSVRARSCLPLPSSNPRPIVASLDPASVTAGAAAFTLTVNGTHFVSGAVVSLDANNLTTTFVSSTRLTAAVPATAVASAHTANLIVTNPAPGGGAGAAVTLTVAAPAGSTYQSPTGAYLDPTAAQTWVTPGQPITSDVFVPASLRADVQPNTGNMSEDERHALYYNPDGTHTGLIDDMGEGKAILVRPDHVLIVGEQRITDQREFLWHAAELSYRRANNSRNVAVSTDGGSTRAPLSTVIATSQPVYSNVSAVGYPADWSSPAFFDDSSFTVCTVPGGTLLDAAHLVADAGQVRTITTHRSNPFNLGSPYLRIRGAAPMPAGVDSDLLTITFLNNHDFTVTSASTGLLGTSATPNGFSYSAWRNFPDPSVSEPCNGTFQGTPTLGIYSNFIYDSSQDWVAGDTVEILFQKTHTFDQVSATDLRAGFTSRVTVDANGPWASDQSWSMSLFDRANGYVNYSFATDWAAVPGPDPYPALDFQSGDGMATVFRVNPDNTITKTGWSGAGIASLENNSMCRLQEGYAAITDTNISSDPPYADHAYATARGWTPGAIGLGVIYVSPEGAPSPYTAFYYSPERFASTFASQLAALGHDADPIRFDDRPSVAAVGAPGSGEFIFADPLRHDSSGDYLHQILLLHLRLNTSTGLVEVLDEQLLDTGMSGTQRDFSSVVQYVNDWLATVPGASQLDANAIPTDSQSTWKDGSFTHAMGLSGYWTVQASWNPNSMNDSGVNDIAESATTFADGTALFMMSVANWSGNYMDMNAQLSISGTVDPAQFEGATSIQYERQHYVSFQSGRALGMLHVAAPGSNMVPTVAVVPAAADAPSYNSTYDNWYAYDANGQQIALSAQLKANILAGIPSDATAIFDRLAPTSGMRDWDIADEGFITAGEGRVAAFGNLDRTSRTVVSAADFTDPAHPTFFPSQPLGTARWGDLEARGLPAVHLGGNVFMVTGGTNSPPPGWTYEALGVATFKVDQGTIINGGMAFFDLGGEARDDENKICALDSHRVFIAAEADSRDSQGNWNGRRSSQIVVSK